MTSIVDKKPSKSRAMRLAGLVGGGSCALLIALACWGLYLRYGRSNFHTVVDAKVFRSAQPSLDELERWIDQYSLTTVINLRGATRESFYQAQRRLCRKRGVEMIDIHFTAARMPTRDELARLIDALEAAPGPVLLHCRDGVDRTGTAAVMAAMALGGQGYAQARKQLSPRYLHSGVMEGSIAEIFSEYERYCLVEKLDQAAWPQFAQWARRRYYPYYFHIEISSRRSFTVSPGQSGRATLVLTNRSHRTIPAGDEDKSFEVVIFAGSPGGAWPAPRAGGSVLLPKADIAPGHSVQVVCPLPVRHEATREELFFDLWVDMGSRRTSFGKEGSAVWPFELVVSQPGDTPDDTRRETRPTP